MRRKSCAALAVVMTVATLPVPVAAQARHEVTQAQVTILSSNLANGNTVGEWGLSALAEADGICVLFDAGRHPETVVHNARELGIDLSCVSDVVLSHFHPDHTAGLNALIDTLRPDAPDAIRRVHVARGFFEPRRVPQQGDGEFNQMIAERTALEARGVEFVIHDGPAEIAPGIWATGSVPRTTPEKTYPAAIKIERDGEWVEDFVPESQGLSVLTPEGHIVILGCGHSGVVNLLNHVQAAIADRPIHALMGGLHLFNATDEALGWTADRLREIGVHNLMAGHCTGIEPLFRLRAGLNLTRRTAVVGAVGSRFVLGEGIQPTVIAM